MSGCQLPPRQALHSTFGLVGAPPADRFLVALGVLTLLADVAVGARLVAETAGNPLALIELTRELSPAEFAGVAALPDALRVAGSLQEVFARRLSRLRAEARLLLALAAAEQTAPQALIWRAAERLGIDPEAAASEVGNLAEFTSQVVFRHPLVRSVAYHHSPLVQRHQIHRALADVTGAGEHPDRVAWHLAMAAIEPDDAVAARLEEAAERARGGGGPATGLQAATGPARARRDLLRQRAG